MTKNRLNLIKTSYDGHLYLVLNDPDFLEKASKIEIITKHYKFNDSTRKVPNKIQVKELADDFLINTGDLTRYLVTGFNTAFMRSTALGKSYITIDKDLDSLKIILDPKITKAEYIELWKYIKKRSLDLTSPSKRKPNSNPELIYAIFKALKSGIKFPIIHEAYMNGELELYDKKPISRFYTLKGLRDYYNLYKPQIN